MPARYMPLQCSKYVTPICMCSVSQPAPSYSLFLQHTNHFTPLLRRSKERSSVDPPIKNNQSSEQLLLNIGLSIGLFVVICFSW